MIGQTVGFDVKEFVVPREAKPFFKQLKGGDGGRDGESFYHFRSGG